MWSYSETTRTGQPFERKKCTVERVYKGSDGAWKSTGSLDANDVPKAILVLSRAYAYMQEGTSDPASSTVREEYIEDGRSRR